MLTTDTLTLIAVFAPLVGAIIAGLFRPFIGKSLSVAGSIVFMLVSAAAGVGGFFQYEQSGGLALASVHIANWISVAQFTPDWSLRQDTLSLVMVAMVSFVSMLIHVYSAGYMAHDKTVPRFFALYVAVHLRHADAGDREQFGAAFLRLGRGRARLVSSHWLLV